jgi:hypothetical protein
MLPGITLSFQSIMNSQVLSVKTFIDGFGGEDTVKSYFGYEGSNFEQALSVVHFAKRNKECKEQRCLFEEEEPWKPLSKISVIELDDFVDAPAHLLFLGIVKAVFQLVVTWLSSKDCIAQFCRHVGGYLEEIKRACVFLGAWSCHLRGVGWVVRLVKT